MQKKIRLVLVRHTRTNWNAEGRYSGQSDVPELDEVGCRDARLIGCRLNMLPYFRPIAALVSSDLRRAKDTATLISIGIQIRFETDARLREASLGIGDGMLKRDFRSRYVESWHSTRTPGFDFSDLGGEKEAAVISRHHECFLELKEKHGSICPPHPTVVIVGHGTSLRSFLGSLKGKSFDVPQGGFVGIESYPVRVLRPV